MIEITLYHWVWYLLGFIFAPKLTIMVWLSIYFKTVLPLPLFVIGWVFITSDFFYSIKKFITGDFE